MKSSAKSKSYIAAFDTEDDGHGNPTLFALVHAGGSFWARSRDSFHDALRALRDRVSGRSGTGARLTLWATNLEYDLVNLFGPAGMASVALRFGRSHLVSARWEQIEFRDTLRHVPASVAELGEHVGLPKLEGDLFEKGKRITEEKLVRRCVRDTTITYRFAKKLTEIYASLGVTPRTTLASTAYHLWEEKFYGRKLLAAPAEIVSNAKEAYHGGRTEPFHIGETRSVTVCDVASMFPWAMLSADFPVPFGAVRRSKVVSETGLFRVRVRSDLPVPCLPVRTRNGTCYPNGEFSGWYMGEEIQNFIRVGGRLVRVFEGYQFLESIRPFDGYVRTLFDRKSEARGALRLVYKILLNSLYGKFGQGGSRVVTTPLGKWEQNGRPHEWDSRVWNGLVIYRTEAPPPPWGNNLWAAIITARARVRLHQEILALRAAGARVLYCDTDSVMYTGIPPMHPMKAENAGDFETRGVYKRLLVAGKKEYGLEHENGTWEFHVKGVPWSERGSYLHNGRANFDRPNRLLESTRNGGTPNAWESRVKVRRVDFSKRARTRDGLLAPLIIRES